MTSSKLLALLAPGMDLGSKKREDCSFSTLCLSVLFKCFVVKMHYFEILKSQENRLKQMSPVSEFNCSVLSLFIFSEVPKVSNKKKRDLNKKFCSSGFHYILKNLFIFFSLQNNTLIFKGKTRKHTITRDYHVK